MLGYMNAKKVTDVEIGDRCGTLGYVVAIMFFAAYQQTDGAVVKWDHGVTLYFRSKPLSATGKLRGVDRGTVVLCKDDSIIVE